MLRLAVPPCPLAPPLAPLAFALEQDPADPMEVESEDREAVNAEAKFPSLRFKNRA